jgi:hypothetical protein
MKYFTKELWLRLQDLTNQEAVEAEWTRQRAAYEAQLGALQGRVGPGAWSFFTEADVHDGHLVELSISQPERPLAWHGSPDDEHPVSVSLAVREEHDGNIWRVTYSHVRRVAINYPSEGPLFQVSGEGFGDWGYHELTDAGDDFLKHAVLFASGATVEVECRHVMATNQSPAESGRAV